MGYKLLTNDLEKAWNVGITSATTVRLLKRFFTGIFSKACNHFTAIT